MLWVLLWTVIMAGAWLFGRQVSGRNLAKRLFFIWLAVNAVVFVLSLLP